MFKKIYIEITNVCNLKCTFCKEHTRPAKFLSLEELEKILQKIQPFTSYVYLHVLGEPLLHPNLQQIILRCQDYGLKVNLTTNGTLLHQQQHILLSPQIQNIHQINISLHSQFKSYMTPEKYYTYLKEFIHLVSDKFYLNLRLWNQSNDRMTAENEQLLQTFFHWFDTDQASLLTLNRKKSLALTPNVFVQIDEKFTWPNKNGEIKFLQGKCYGLRDHIAILSDGTVTPCCLDGEGQIKLGNIFLDHLENILNTSRAQNIKRSFQQKQVYEHYCQTCGFALRNNQ